MRNDPVGAIGKGGSRTIQVGQDNLRKAVRDTELSARVLQNNIQKSERALQCLIEASCV